MSHTVTINDKTIEIKQFGAKEGWKLLRKLLGIISPTVTALEKEQFGEAISKAIESLPEDKMIALINQLTSVVLVDGKKFSDDDLRSYMFTLEVCYHVLEYNYEDFFSKIKEMLGVSKTDSLLKAM